MSDRWQMRREGHVEIIPARVYQKSRSLPGKVMVMRDGWDTRFGNEFSECKAEGNVHGYGEGILGNNEIDIVFLNKIVECPFKLSRYLVDRVRCFSVSRFFAE